MMEKKQLALWTKSPHKPSGDATVCCVDVSELFPAKHQNILLYSVQHCQSPAFSCDDLKFCFLRML